MRLSLDQYQAHLDRVSRSFAFCIAGLNRPLRDWVSMGYVLCRLLDTVEDTAWDDDALFKRQYGLFNAFLSEPAAPGDVAGWVAAFPHSVPLGEQQLLNDAAHIFADLKELPEAPRQAITETALQMSHGMQHYSLRQNGGVRLHDGRDVNRYCFFVAGIVGHLLSRLYTASAPHFVPPPHFAVNATHFGLFLQKVNLLKDQTEDERAGRFLVPHRPSVWQSLKAHAHGALHYILAIPQDSRDYRTFCAWSLFLGLASLPFIGRADLPAGADLPAKLPRHQALTVLQDAARVAPDDAALADAFERAMAPLAGLLSGARPPDAGHKLHDDDEVFLRLAKASMPKAALKELDLT